MKPAVHPVFRLLILNPRLSNRELRHILQKDYGIGIGSGTIMRARELLGIDVAYRWGDSGIHIDEERFRIMGTKLGAKFGQTSTGVSLRVVGAKISKL